MKKSFTISMSKLGTKEQDDECTLIAHTEDLSVHEVSVFMRF